jgi:glycosyltransferase involved in cell wall biosynthesis
MTEPAKPTLLVLASTYPRWRNDPEPGFVHELCRRLARSFNVIAMVPDAPGADPSGVFDGVDIVRYRYAPRRWQTLVNHGGIATNLQRAAWKWLLVPAFVGAQYLAARRLLKRRQVDVIHAHWLLPQGLIARSLSRGMQIPYVVTSHGGDLFGLRSRLLVALKRRVASSAAAMTVVSSAMSAEAERLDLRPPVLQVLPMGVDLRERFVVDPDVPRASDTLLFVGRLVPKKGLRHLLDAMPVVLARRPGVVLDLAGFGPEEQALRAQAERLAISDSVRFLGAMPQHELPALYRSASLFVAPFIRDDSGNQEGLPVVLMEAIGCGCPVVVGDVAGVQDLLGDAKYELCVKPADTGALAAAIIEALEHPVQARARASMIRDRALDLIDWEFIAQRYAALIGSCVSGSAVRTKTP